MSESGGLTARLATLGLLAVEPDSTAGLFDRLRDEFPHAQWPRTTAYKHAESLSQSGLARLVERGATRSADRYEATPEGVALLRDWVRSSSPPQHRDPWQAKLNFCGGEDLPFLIEAIRGEEARCAQEYGAAHARARRAGHARLRRPEGLRDRLRVIAIADEGRRWAQEAQRLQRTREALEELLAELRGEPQQR